MPSGRGYPGRGAAGKKPTSTKSIPHTAMRDGGGVHKVSEMRADGIKGIQYSDPYSRTYMSFKGAGRK